MARKAALSAGSFVLILVAILETACVLQPLPEKINEVAATANPLRIVVSSATLTLAWFQPSREVINYKLYYKPYGVDNAQWQLLGELPAAGNPEYTISRSQVGTGEFVFGVSAVYLGGRETATRSSLDPTSLPSRGWYLLWQE